jgi:tRNA A-37 threonylcarbamoyl transferase component Bud32
MDVQNFVKIRQAEWSGFVHRDFKDLSPACLAGQTPPDAHRTSLEKVASSDTAEVYRYSVRTHSGPCILYLKKYSSRSWLDQAKHLVRPSRAQRAFRAALLLERYGLQSPQPAAMLIRQKGLLVDENLLITLQIPEACSLYTLLESRSRGHGGPSLADIRRMIAELGATIGRMHKARIVHGDLRSGNIFVSKAGGNWTFYFIDNERTARSPFLPFRGSIKNLVQLNMLRRIITHTDRLRFLRAYATGAGLSKQQSRRVAWTVIKRTQKRLKHRSRTRVGTADASMTNHWAFQRSRSGRRKGIFRMDFCTGDAASDFLREIDHLMETGQVLKQDTATSVVRCTYNKHDVVIKRYNYQGLWHSLRHTLKGSRAQKSWRYGHRLMSVHIPCAAPLGLIEERFFGMIRQSYIINDYIEGPLLYDVMNRPGYSPQEREAVMQKSRHLLEALGRNRFTHADMKPANLIIHKNQPVLIDLDSMDHHRLSFYFRYRYNKMVTYFHRRVHGKTKKYQDGKP